MFVKRDVTTGFLKNDSALAVSLMTDEAVPVLVANAVETPALSGQYVCSFEPLMKDAFWYVAGLKRDEFSRVKLYDSHDERLVRLAVDRTGTTWTFDRPYTTALDAAGDYIASIYGRKGAALVHISDFTRSASGIVIKPPVDAVDIYAIAWERIA